MAQVVECLPSKHKVLTLSPVSPKQERKEKGSLYWGVAWYGGHG
jgi:hypothetical protein